MSPYSEPGTVFIVFVKVRARLGGVAAAPKMPEFYTLGFLGLSE